MANYTLVARINTGDGKFPFVTVQFTKNHRPIPIAGATYYLRPCNRGSRTPVKIGKDVNAAMAALLKTEHAPGSGNVVAERAGSVSSASALMPRKTVAEAAREYIERSREKSRRTFIGYRTAVNLFLQSCAKRHFDEIRRDEMLDYLRFLRTHKSRKTNGPFGESTVFNYFLKAMVFLNDRGIAKHVAKEDWVQKKDWPINVDNRNKNKKYSTYLEEEIGTSPGASADLAAGMVYDFAGKKSATVAGSTPGIRRLGSGGTGIRPYRLFHLAQETRSKIPGAGLLSVVLKSSSLKYFRTISMSSSDAYVIA